MLRKHFNISGQTLVAAVITTTLLYLLLSVLQPVGAALGAVLRQATGVAKTVPPYLNYQGILRDAEGKPMSGIHKLTFRIYRDVTAPLPEAVWMEEHPEVTVRDGQFSVLLGNNKPVPPELFTGPDMFIGVTVAPPCILKKHNCSLRDIKKCWHFKCWNKPPFSILQSRASHS